MADSIAPRFRKTKSDKWAVMAPIEDLEKALATGGNVEVQRKSGDWTTFTIGSLGKPFDVDGVMMCYGYAPEESDDDATGPGLASHPNGADVDDRRGRPAGTPRSSVPGRQRNRASHHRAPPADPTEPLPEYQGGSEDEWDGYA